MFCRLWFAIGIVVAIGQISRAAQPDWTPLPFHWSKIDGSVINLSGYLHVPAGKDGFLRVVGSHIIQPNGKRFRFWGVNICGQNCFPTRSLAPLLADDLARWGFNVVRLHHLDSDWGRSIFDRARDNTQHLDAESLDRLDFLVAELKKRGIYSNLNLNVLRKYKAADGVRDFQLLGIGKATTYFSPRLIELQEQFARLLLTHKNAYTGNEYRNEPAVAVVEIVNENSLFEAWLQGRLVGRDDKAGSDWSTIPKSYGDELTALYNDWLKQNLSADELAARRKDAKVGSNDPLPRLDLETLWQAGRERFLDEAHFYAHLEADFFARMKKLLRDELGVKSMLVGCADHNDWISGYPHVQSCAMFDVIDSHGYWQHPEIGKETKIQNTPMVNDPLDSTVVQFARTPIAGKPFTISEVSHPFPHKYACEGYLILTAYALFQGWDGIYWFDWGAGRGTPPDQGTPPYGWFTVSSDPVKLANLAVSGLMWHRQDVQPSHETQIRSLGSEKLYDSLRADAHVERPFFMSGFARSTPLQMGVRYEFAAESKLPEHAAAPLGRILSDTGELAWLNADRQRGVVKIATERTQALIGFVKGSDASTANLAADVQNDFCAIAVTSLDDKPIATSSKLLLVATSHSQNAGQRWKEDGQTLAQWGSGPMLIDPVKGTATLRIATGDNVFRVVPLTAEGRPRLEALRATKTKQGWQVPLGEPPTTWYLISQ